MSRAQRLLDLIQRLRRHRRPVAGAVLAQDLGISLRTLYRDIATLQAQGAPIDGSAGLGYLLREGYVLPPLMFAAEEIEALVLGSRWVAQLGDEPLAEGARDALAKIAAVLPAPLRHELDSTALIVGPTAAGEPAAAVAADLLATVRLAIREQRKLRFDYRDAAGRASRRTVWPFALGYFERVRVLAAWCESREAMRHFRADRIAALHALAERYPRSRQSLLADWKAQQGIAADRN